MRTETTFSPLFNPRIPYFGRPPVCHISDGTNRPSKVIKIKLNAAILRTN
jgi:hypothetical protein